MAAGAEKPKPFKLARQVAKARRLALLDAATARPISEVVAASQRIVAARADPAVSLGLGATLRTQQLDSEIAALALERTERGRADGRTGGLEIHEYFLRHFDDTLLAVVDDARREAVQPGHRVEVVRVRDAVAAPDVGDCVVLGERAQVARTRWWGHP